MQSNNNKIIFVVFAAALMISFSFAAAFSIQAESNEDEILDEIEDRMWGRTYQHTLERRVERLEYQLYGQRREGDINNRLQSLRDYILPDDSAPSLGYLLSFLEYLKSQPSPADPFVDRLELIEKKFNIQPFEQAVVPRLHRLFELTKSDDSISENPTREAPTAEVNLEPGTKFLVNLETSVDSGRSQTGKLIDFTLMEDFVVDDVLVLPAGSTGRMRLRDKESAGFLGRDGKLSLQGHSLHSLDGQRLRFSPASPEPEGVVDSSIYFLSRNRSRFYAAGAGIAGALILDHPGGLIFSLAVPGREEKYEQGEIMELEITSKADVLGIPLEGD